MKKNLLLVMLLMISFAFAQVKPIAQQINQLKSQGKTFQKFELFSEDKDLARSQKFQKSASEVTILKLEKNQLNRLNEQNPTYLELTIPYASQQLTLQLYKSNVLTDDFQARDEKGNLIPYQPGKFYRGIVAGDPTSVVAVSIFEDDIQAVVATSQGNYNLGQSKDKSTFLVYLDKNLLGQTQFSCGVDEIEYNQKLMEDISYQPEMAAKMMTNNCVRVYYEIGFSPYTQNGSNTTQTLNWITSVHNNIATLYTNDDIKTALSEVMIWTTQDPYVGGFQENLYNFAATRTEFNGDLAHFVNYPSTTSVAFLDSLCSDLRYAYSGIDIYFQEVPVYSWTIGAMTHEMGHALGSPHTHACAWNGNNTAIDGCGVAGGYPEGCDGPIPPNGGTIMSYCHLVSFIDLTQGFGPQPSALIRSTVDSKLCLSQDCVSTCDPTMDNFTLKINVDNSINIGIVDEISDTWHYQIVPYGQSWTDNWSSTTEKNFQIPALTPGFYEIYIGNRCDNGIFGKVIRKIVWVGDLCHQYFTDTGGPNGNYGDNQEVIATFYPTLESDKVSVTIQYDLETNYDFLEIYNGDSIYAPMLSSLTGSANSQTFTSTAENGAITFRFISDAGYTAPGWNAEINCAILNVSDVNNQNLKIYPNPASSVVFVEAKSEIKNIQLLDISGKLISKKSSNKTKDSISIEHLPKGTYVLTIQTKEETITKKIVKK